MTIVPDHVLDEAARRFALLGDATRLRIVSRLHDCGECSVGDLASKTNTSLQNVSQHLSRLLAGGVVKRRRVGKTVLYSIGDPTIEGLCNVVCSSVSERARVLSG
jgi:DNA-binding transcriptional ArsR family regulator